VIYAWCEFSPFALAGQCTPAPFDPPRLLVAHGHSGVMRDPIYGGVGLELLGEAKGFHSEALLRYLLGFILVTHLFVVFYEEPTPRRKFGQEYEEYCGGARDGFCASRVPGGLPDAYAL
jgi:protein-S-isoprenylcysteine O-methyltransferase Ste14